MTTFVLFLDDASRHVGSINAALAEQTVITLIATLRSIKKLNSKIALNTACSIAQYQISDQVTLQMILKGNKFREEWDFIRQLSDRSPFSRDFDDELAQEISELEFRTRPGQVLSRALAWATLMNTAIVSLDAHPDWSKAWVDTSLTKLDEVGNIVESDGRVRNASQIHHADEHQEWLKILGLAPAPTATQMWAEKDIYFKGLRFLPRVEKDLETLERGAMPFSQAFATLKALSKDAEDWEQNNSWPEFSNYATPEASQRQKLCFAVDEMTGKEELFDWHVRFTGGVAGRIHFRVDVPNRLFVVAYVGGKLTRKI